MQDATKKFGEVLLVSDAVRSRLPTSFNTHEVGLAALSGITGEVRLHEHLAEVGSDMSTETAKAVI